MLSSEDIEDEETDSGTGEPEGDNSGQRSSEDEEEETELGAGLSGRLLPGTGTTSELEQCLQTWYTETGGIPAGISERH